MLPGLMAPMVGEVVYLLPFTLWLSWMADPMTGATLGKRLLGLRIHDTHNRPAPAATRWVRHGIQTVGLWGLSVALVAGSWIAGLLASVAGTIVLLANIVLLVGTGRTLHDRLSGAHIEVD
jgi:uncharacterized RDD family membrane protein YckC